MPVLLVRRLALLLIAAALSSALGASAALAAPCRDQTLLGTSYIVCRFDPAVDDLRLFWRTPDGRPYRTFDALARALQSEGRTLLFAMNGGMYERDLSPVGLHIENGRVLSRANTKTVKGRPGQIPNFYKRPNGVFYWGRGGAGVLETGRFLARKPKADFATQSGPMLVIDGGIHPAFIANSRDVKPRDGVGVGPDGKVYFVMTRGPVSFYDFARAFRDGLGVKNALFLDGGWAPGLYVPELERNDPPAHGGYGPIIAVIR
ncbi:phosphodiester glycosidase family protein [Methyloceanibacter sp.]|uniref:phosphodiester glycosidase family protein n=1 Tax=Methyloceanibacter sp. TaxID=1965321 RepID=UPI002B5EDBF4|nr:phosphodiester glycosidase family protein [Methyloceanibacter sp.]HML90938.1 phosphodiester glycosidase family protein [Methyloceanibacter sp.]